MNLVITDSKANDANDESRNFPALLNLTGHQSRVKSDPIHKDKL